jgi:hypothetical protein
MPVSDFFDARADDSILPDTTNNNIERQGDPISVAEA